MLILTLEEIKNGWTETSLKRYHKEMERESHEVIYGQRQPQKQKEQNHRYRPHRWRK